MCHSEGIALCRNSCFPDEKEFSVEGDGQDAGGLLEVLVAVAPSFYGVSLCSQVPLLGDKSPLFPGDKALVGLVMGPWVPVLLLMTLDKFLRGLLCLPAAAQTLPIPKRGSRTTFTEDRQSAHPSHPNNCLTPRPTLPGVPLSHGGSFRPSSRGLPLPLASPG